MEPSECLPPELERFWRTDDGLTACERAEAYGIDLSLLEDNLRLTPAERLRRNDEALNAAENLVAKSVRDCEVLGLDGMTTFEVMLDGLISAKRAAGRSRDLHAVLELEAIRERRRG